MNYSKNIVMKIEQPGNDLLSIETSFLRASTGKRFLNYLIDLFCFTVVFVIVGVLLTAITPIADDFVDSDFFGLATTILYALFMSIIEACLQGKSFGKFVTKTRAINLDGSNISIKTAFSRGFIRIVPFCALSALGNPCNPWQDRWCNTMVIDERKSEIH